MSDLVVLIPHFNNPSGLLKSLNSIRESEKIDVLIVDDGSKVKTLDERFLAENVKANIQLKYIYLPANKGIEHALNSGLSYIKECGYDFIARLDCGDICEQERFSIQKNYLIDHPEIGMVGSWVRFFDENGKDAYGVSLPTSDFAIRRKMYLNAMFIHPSIMLNSCVLEKVPQYPTTYEAAEDYAFFFEVIRYFKVANIDKYLVHCEINPSGISLKKRKIQVKSRIRLIVKNFRFGFYPVYGLIRNLLIYTMPYSLILFLKKMFR